MRFRYNENAYFLKNALECTGSKTFENHRIASCDKSWSQCACYKHTLPAIFSVIVLILLGFRQSTLIRYVCIFVWTTFKSVFDENANAKRMSVSGRPRRIEMHAFENENALVCTGFKSMRLDINYDIACYKLCEALWQRGGKRKESLQLRLWNLNSISNPCGSLSTELSYFCHSVQSGNERECKQTLKSTCQG